jgi:hypothetical protein
MLDVTRSSLGPEEGQESVRLHYEMLPGGGPAPLHLS